MKCCFFANGLYFNYFFYQKFVIFKRPTLNDILFKITYNNGGKMKMK